MGGLPAIKFVFLAIRQVTRPIAKQIVARANAKRAVTHRLCIGLGRVSLGLSGVISEWSRTEERKQVEAKKKTEEEAHQKLKNAGSAADVSATPAAEAHRDLTAAAAVGESQSSSATKAEVTTATPRSRSLLQSIVYGPQTKDTSADAYDGTVFLDPSRTAGEAARVFIRYPYRSTWDVFRQTFLAPFPEDRLVAAGADLLIELLAYTVLCTLLVIELLQQSKASAAKEAHVQARLEAIESKINELVERSNEDGVAASAKMKGLIAVPEVEVSGRLGGIWGAAKSTASYVKAALSPNSSGDSEAVQQDSSRGNRWSEAAEMPFAHRSSMLVPRVPPPDPAIKTSKHDETILMRQELDALLREKRST